MKRSELAQWRGGFEKLGALHRRFLLLDGTALRYYAPRDVLATTLLSTELRLAPAHVSAAAAEQTRHPLPRSTSFRSQAAVGVAGWPVATVTLSRTAVCLSLLGGAEGEELPPLMLHRKSVAAITTEAPAAFAITGQDDRRLLLAAADEATRDEWIKRVQAVIKSLFFSPHALKGTVDLAQADSVRTSTPA